MSDIVFNALVDTRGDPSARRALDDYCMERGWRPPRLGVAMQIAADAATADAATADADAATADADADAANADADAATAATADADAATATADADADAADAANADADAADAANADADAAIIRKILTSLLTKEIEVNMRDGLKLVQVPGRYGCSVTLVGWLKRIIGDEYELHGAVTVVRTSGQWKNDGIQRLAEKPQKGYDITKPATLPEELHRLSIRRVLVADADEWAEKCPKPKSYDTKAEAA